MEESWEAKAAIVPIYTECNKKGIDIQLLSYSPHYRETYCGD
jgi:hypothetical protein